jgi:ActR/RegA family two-component response regulator
MIRASRRLFSNGCEGWILGQSQKMVFHHQIQSACRYNACSSAGLHLPRTMPPPGNSKRILFVDDEPSIRLTLPPVLEENGFEVRVAGSVPEALVEINSYQFDILLSDLNIGEEGDGFLVVSAMRHLQPQCINLILTGYPAFETALQAIHNQVDDYLVKPADVEALIDSMKEKLSSRGTGTPTSPQRLSAILRVNVQGLGRQLLDVIKRDPKLSALSFSDEERLADLPKLLSSFAEQLERQEDFLSPEQQRLVSNHAKRRRKQGYTVPLLTRDFQSLEQVVYNLIDGNLKAVETVTLLPDLRRLQKGTHAALEKCLEVFIEAKRIAN